MVRRSVPPANKFVPNECITAWVVTRLAIPAAARPGSNLGLTANSQSTSSPLESPAFA